MNNFNFMGFLLAHQKGKKLSKSDRNKTALLSAFIPSDNFSGVLTPLALADKEVAKLEKNEVSEQLQVTTQTINRAENFVLDLVDTSSGSAEDIAGAAEIYLGYIQRVNPNIRAESLEQNSFFQKIQNTDVRSQIRNQLILVGGRQVGFSQATLARVTKSASKKKES